MSVGWLNTGVGSGLERSGSSEVSQDAFGRIVCARSPLVDGSGWLATIWFVAIDDDDVEIKRFAPEAWAPTITFCVGQLEPDAVQSGATRGQAVSYP